PYMGPGCLDALRFGNDVADGVSEAMNASGRWDRGSDLGGFHVSDLTSRSRNSYSVWRRNRRSRDPGEKDKTMLVSDLPEMATTLEYAALSMRAKLITGTAIGLLSLCQNSTATALSQAGQ